MPFAQVLNAQVLSSSDQRQSPRRRADVPAWVDIENGSKVRTCTIWDVSDAGARITIDSPSDVPQEFSLLLSADGTIRRRCRVIWRSDEQIGASYIAAADWNWTA